MPAGFLGALFLVHDLFVHKQKHGDERDERDGIGEKTECDAHRCNEGTCYHGAYGAREIRLGRIERHRIAEIVAPYHFVDERLTRRTVYYIDKTEENRRNEEHPYLYQVRIDQERECERHYREA